MKFENSSSDWNLRELPDRARLIAVAVGETRRAPSGRDFAHENHRNRQSLGPEVVANENCKKMAIASSVRHMPAFLYATFRHPSGCRLFTSTHRDQFFRPEGEPSYLDEAGRGRNSILSADLTLLVGDEGRDFFKLSAGNSKIQSNVSTAFFSQIAGVDELRAQTAENKISFAGDGKLFVFNDVILRSGFDLWVNRQRYAQSIQLSVDDANGFQDSAFRGRIEQLAAYADIQIKSGQLSILPGLRAESRRYFLNLGNGTSRSFADLFPSVHLEYEISKSTKAKASYSRRIAWPSLNDLNFVTRPQNFGLSGRGNPNLTPQITNGYELSTTTKIDQSQLGFIFSYKVTDRLFALIARIENGKTVYVAENVNRLETLGGTIYLRGSIRKRLEYSLSARLASKNFAGGKLANCCERDLHDYSFSGDLTYRESSVGQKGGDQFRFAMNYSGPTQTGFSRRSSSGSVSAAWTHWWSTKVSSVVDASDLNFRDTSETEFSSDLLAIRQKSRLRGPKLKLSLVLGL